MQIPSLKRGSFMLSQHYLTMRICCIIMIRNRFFYKQKNFSLTEESFAIRTEQNTIEKGNISSLRNKSPCEHPELLLSV